MARQDPQFNLRIPADLRDKVMDAAAANKRSATAEIIARLESTFEESGRLSMKPGVQKLAGLSGYTPEVATKLAHADLLIEEMRERIFRVIDDAISEAGPPPTAAATPKKKPAHKIKWDASDKK